MRTDGRTDMTKLKVVFNTILGRRLKNTCFRNGCLNSCKQIEGFKKKRAGENRLLVLKKKKTSSFNHADHSFTI